MQANLVRACHDLSEGGLAVALAEMCIGGRLGCRIKLDTDDIVSALFSESNGRLLVEVRPEGCAAFESYLATLPAKRIGAVTEETTLNLSNRSETMLSLPVASLVAAWNRNL
jgi:phosphoribosylformylglycinamidine (FGAM) synthase-like enzyme